jgi:HNH endonuclease/AP2 domain
LRPTPTEIRKVLRYDRFTGLLWWRERASGRRLDRPAGTKNANGYIDIGYRGKVYKAHILAHVIVKGRWPKRELDHHNLIRNNNRWKNLRPATRGQNSQNRRCYKNNKTGIKGVHFHPLTGRFTADIQVNKKLMYLGIFDTPEEAAVVYNAANKKYHGKFARTS